MWIQITHPIRSILESRTMSSNQELRSSQATGAGGEPMAFVGPLAFFLTLSENTKRTQFRPNPNKMKPLAPLTKRTQCRGAGCYPARRLSIAARADWQSARRLPHGQPAPLHLHAGLPQQIPDGLFHAVPALARRGGAAILARRPVCNQPVGFEHALDAEDVIAVAHYNRRL